MLNLKLGKKQTFYTYNEKTKQYEKTELPCNWREVTPEEIEEIEKNLKDLDNQECEKIEIILSKGKICN